MSIIGLEIPNKPSKGDLGDFIDNCLQIDWKEEEVKKWMKKQAIRCLTRGDDDRAI